MWSSYSAKVLYSWAAVGSTVLLLLFQGSTSLTESISAGKYTEYVDYQRAVGSLVPTSVFPYKTPVAQPKVIRTSELEKKLNKKKM